MNLSYQLNSLRNFLEQTVIQKLNGRFHLKDYKIESDPDHVYIRLVVEIYGVIIYHREVRIHLGDPLYTRQKYDMLRDLMLEVTINGLRYFGESALHTIPPSLPEEYHPEQIDHEAGRKALKEIKRVTFEYLAVGDKQQKLEVFTTREDRRRVAIQLEKLEQYINQIYIKYGREDADVPPVQQ